MSDDDLAVQAADQVRVVFGRLRRRLQEAGGGEGDDLSPSQASALARIAKHDAATASALADLEGIRPQSMATILAALEQRGLVQRAPDPTDRRRQIVTLTEAGRSREGGNRTVRREWFVQAVQERLDARELRTVIEAMALLDRLTRP